MKWTLSQEEILSRSPARCARERNFFIALSGTPAIIDASWQVPNVDAPFLHTALGTDREIKVSD